MARRAKKILVAPAWPYAAGHRHLGHVAGFGVPSDVFARYHRLQGQRRAHGERHGRARHAGDGRRRSRKGSPTVRSRTTTTRRSATTSAGSGSRTTCFSRTTTLNHERVTQDIFRTLYEHGAIVEQRDARLVLAHHRPHAARPLHRGHVPDLRLHGGARRPVRQLRQPARPDRADQPALEDRRRDARSSARRSTCFSTCRSSPSAAPLDRARTTTGGRTSATSRSRLLDEIRPRPITRDLDWGVPIPIPGYAEDPNKRIYVWFDAVIGYLSASIEWAASTGDPDAWREWWQNPESEHAYFQGKDNIVFHTVIWPAMLLGYGEGGELRRRPRRRSQLPDNVVATEYLTMEGKQFSTSRGHVDLPRATSSSATTPTRSATTWSRRARRRRTPTSRGPSSCAATTTSCSRTGGTSSTAR